MQAKNSARQSCLAAARFAQDAKMLGLKSFWNARSNIAGIESMYMTRKGQLGCPEGQTMLAAQQFYSLAA